MVYGHYIDSTAGGQRFFVEGCSYCQMSTGGSHEFNCPMKDIKVADIPPQIQNIQFRRLDGSKGVYPQV